MLPASPESCSSNRVCSATTAASFWKATTSARLPSSAFTEPFVQDNHSYSERNVIRGLHYQIRQPQGKLVRAITGEILDVALDLRRSSPTFGKWESFKPFRREQTHLWIPVRICSRLPSRVRNRPCLSIRRRTFMRPSTNGRVAWNDPDAQHRLATRWRTDRLRQGPARDQVSGLREVPVRPCWLATTLLYYDIMISLWFGGSYGATCGPEH